VTACVIVAVLGLSPWELGEEVCPGDLARFPADALLAAECYELARDHQRWVEEYVMGGPHLNGHEMNARASRSREAWQRAWQYREGGTGEEWIVYELRILRAVIGAENYRAGVMPDPVPHRRLMRPKR
jgi:hypothetical protein